ncbi:hypothetical protein DID96_29045 [Burkholderia sp. Bp8963]|uniref:DsrE family protein n=1 Tax=Burkholderia sp. Bp8963 TaxID=2184547 RepID=UPI000F5932B1|nr:DsrE family protein [Burkholderia sp. Bp8963]RQS64115.1 hypothetical protein DID96_29045 [Burkholderia sp. Bp8963]
MPFLVRTAIAIMIACASVHPVIVSAAGEAAAQAAEAPRVVYHVDDVASMRDALNNIKSQIAVTPNARIILLVNGRGIFALVKGEGDRQGEYGSTVAELAAKGVRFDACGTAMRKNNVVESMLVPNVTVVPSGVVELTRLQTVEHFAYIKP